MSLRVTLRGKVKFLWNGAIGKPSLNRAIESRRVDPKLSEQSMARVNSADNAEEGPNQYAVQHVWMSCG